MANFWENLTRPIFCLAPMEEVTDVAFREMFARYSKNPHPGPLPEGEGGLRMDRPQNDFVMYTEFVNVDGLTHPEGYKKLSLDLKFTEAQRPMVAQIWGTNPEKFYEAAKIIVGLGFDGIDINMGCPQDKEIGIGACAALIRNPKLAGEIIAATKRGAGELPVSVKTRLGYTKTDEMAEWVTFLLKQNIAALALHARTKQEKSKVAAHWEEIKRAVEIRNQLQPDVIARSASRKGTWSPRDFTSGEATLTKDVKDRFGCTRDDRTLIIGNGDVKSRAEGLQRIEQTGCDGVMIGRGAFGNPWIFRADNYEPGIPTLALGAQAPAVPSVGVKERLSVMLEHAELFEKEFSGLKSFYIMRKHFKAYATGFDGAAELRAKLMETKSLEDVKGVVKDYLSSI